MDAIINNFSLAGYKFMPEMKLKQRRFTYTACGPFTKKEERIKQEKKQMNKMNRRVKIYF